ncbi:MAG TPA: glycosyltransferase family 4 protein [Humisphaera sp.]
MRILFCSNVPLRRTLGAPKVVIELADAMAAAGHDCRVIGPGEIGAGTGDVVPGADPYRQRLRAYLREHAIGYDAVDYGHEYLPFPRADFPAGTLMVARSVLLVHHLARVRLPHPPGVARAALRLVSRGARRGRVAADVDVAQRTIRAADLVNVSNDRDAAVLAESGVPASRVVVLPFGLSDERAAALAAVCPGPADGPPVVAFVGTFDYRKGAREFPDIVRRVARAAPAARFRLLGAAGLFATADAVRRALGPAAAAHVDLTMRYDPADLPALLNGCTVGVFPSHVEGFGFGVLEMLAAGLPVVAYDAPGPHMMLPPDLLVPPGRSDRMAQRVLQLSADPAGLRRRSAWARRRAGDFRWATIAAQTAAAYESAMAARGGESRPTAHGPAR